MSVFFARDMGVDVTWAGVALGVAAALEIPALLAIARLNRRVASLHLIAAGCLVGTAYYATMTFVTGAVALIAVQALNAWFAAVVAGVGLTLFQDVIRRPGLYTNTRRVGAIVSGPIIGFGSATALGYGGAFAVCAALTVGALAAIVVAGRTAPSGLSAPAAPPRRRGSPEPSSTGSAATPT